MLEHVELIVLPTIPLGIVNRKRTVADHAREGDAVVDAEVKAIAADGLPREVASDTEPIRRQ